MVGKVHEGASSQISNGFIDDSKYFNVHFERENNDQLKAL